jgi:pimeloyl-ACP methyl ester carboxylesterase
VSTFVLVHGGWHGAWCWSRVVPLLQGEGHEVLVPALTGLGERAHLASPEVDVSTHVRELVDLLETTDASDVVLVGHSYSGVVVTAVAAALPERVSDVVYLDAFVPEEGRSIFDLLPPERVAVFEDAAREHGDGWNVPLPWERAIAGWGVTDPDDVAWMMPLLTPQPLATFHERAGTWATKPAVRRTFVHCLDKPGGDSFAGFAARAASDNDWRFLTLDAGHDAMVTAPAATAAALIAAVV